MRIRSFRVPFSKVVPDDAHEIEFGPDDYMVVRPIFGLPASEIVELSARMESVGEDEKAAALLLEDVLKSAIVEWSLTGEDGKAIAQPRTGDELRALPGALASALYPFLMEYRGEAANPTTRS